MMRRVSLLAFLAAIAMSVLAQEEPYKPEPLPPRPPNKCDLKVKEMTPFCESCNTFYIGKEQEEHKREFKDHRWLKKRTCVRKYYYAECHPENSSFEKGQCCGKDLVEKVDHALVVYSCEGCGSQQFETEKCFNPHCKRGKTRIECSKEPEFPHTDIKMWKEKRAKEQKEKEKNSKKE